MLVVAVVGGILVAWTMVALVHYPSSSQEVPSLVVVSFLVEKTFLVAVLVVQDIVAVLVASQEEEEEEEQTLVAALAVLAAEVATTCWIRWILKDFWLISSLQKLVISFCNPR